MRLLRIYLCCLGCCFAADPAQLDQLIAEALANNREILAAQKRVEAARQRSSPARGLPDPLLSVGYASNGGPLPGQGLGSNPTSNIGVTISQEFTSRDKRRLRGDIAVKEADAAFQDYQSVQLSVRSRISQAYHRLHHTWEALEILEEGRRVLSDVIHFSEARYTAGKTPQQDIFKAQMQLSLMETRIIKMQQDQQTAEAEINTLLNRTPGTPVGQPVEGEIFPLLLTVDELLAKAAATAPELRRDVAFIQRDELGVNLARRELRPDYTIAAGYFNQGGMPPMVQFRVEVPLRLHTESRQRPMINEKVDQLSESRRNFEAAEQSLQFRVREAYLAAQTAWKLWQLYNDTILPQTQLTVEASLNAYQTGATDLAGVLTNIAAKTDVQEQLHEQGLNFALAVARLEEMTGIELRGSR